MPTVDWKGVGLIEFPEDATQEEINRVLSDQEFFIDEKFGLTSNAGWWADVLPNAAERGLRKTVMGVQVARSLAPDLPVIGLSDEEAAIAIREQQARINDIPMSEEARNVLNTAMEQDLYGAVETFISNPGASISIITEGLGASIPAAGALIGTVGTAALMGAALAPIAAAGVAGASSFATEYANVLIDEMIEAGRDPMDVDDFAAGLADEELMADAKESALARGVPIGIVDAATFGLGGMFTQTARAARLAAESGVEIGENTIRTAPRVRDLATISGLETTGGVIGEGLAQFADEGYIARPADLVLEGLAGSVFGGIPNVVSYAAADYAARRRAGITPESPDYSPADGAVVSPEGIADELLADQATQELNDVGTTSAQVLARQERRVEKLRKTVEKQTKKLEEMRRKGQAPDRQGRVEQQLQEQKARLAEAETVASRLREEGDQIFPDLYQPRRPPKTDPTGFPSFLSDLWSRASARVEPAAEANPKIRQMLESVKTFFPEVKNIKGRQMTELNRIVEPFLSSSRIPIISDFRMLVPGQSSSTAYGYNAPAMRALGKALELNPADLTDTRLGQILDAEKVPARYRENFRNVVENARDFYDRQFQAEQIAGIQADRMEGYFPIDIAEAFRSKKNKEKAVKAFADKIKNRAEAERIVNALYDKFNSPDTYVTHLDTLIASGKITPENNPTFARARTLSRPLREALIEADLVSTDFYDVTRRRINQSAISMPISSRIDPIRKEINRMLENDTLSQDEIVGLDRLRDLTYAIEGKTPSGAMMRRGVRNVFRPLTSAMYGATLGLSGITSLPEYATIFAHLRPGDALYGLRRAVFEVMPRKIIRSMKPNYPKSALEQSLEEFMIYMSAPEMAERFTAQSVTDYSTKFTEVFFKTNLLTQITQITRAASAIAFTKAIDSAVVTIETSPKNSKEYQNARRLLRRLGVPDDKLTSMSPRMREMAIVNGVDMTVMAPDPTNRPFWMSHPYLAPVAMLSSFTATFGTTIGKMVWDEVFAGQTSYGENLTPEQRFNAALRYGTMLTLLMGGVLTTISMKEAIKNWDEDEVKYTEKDMTEALQDAFIQTNILGLGSRLIDIFNARQFGRDPFTAAAGPIAGKFSDWTIALNQVATQGEVRRAVREALKMIPFMGNFTSARRAIEDRIMEEIEG